MSRIWLTRLGEVGLAVVQFGDNAAQAALAERDDDTATDDRLRRIFGNAVGEGGVQRNRHGHIAILRHGQDGFTTEAQRTRRKFTTVFVMTRLPFRCPRNETLPRANLIPKFRVLSASVVNHVFRAGGSKPKYFITICKSFHASFFCRGSRSRNAG